MEVEENILGKEKIGKLMRKFSIPCIISMLVNSLYNIVDQIFIGWGVGYLGNGATNIVFPLNMICLAFALMVGDGTSAYLSLKLGEKKKDEAKRGVANGIMTSIIGRPNVGKSSLLNALLEEDKAIVTDIAGTTRDIVEGQVVINGIILNMIDTAGIRETEDLVESIGVEKSKKMIDKSDLILLMLNNNEQLTDDIKEIFEKIKDKNYIVIINKIDLEKKLDINSLDIDKDKIIKISTTENKGLEELKNKIIELFNIEAIETQDPTYLNNSRSISILKNCLSAINDVEEGLKNNMPIDMIELDIKNIWEELGKINGTSYEEELLDEMFSRFCLGK